MRVLHVVDSLHRENGGLPAVVVRLAVAQTAAGMRPAIACRDRDGLSDHVQWWASDVLGFSAVEVIPCGLWPPRVARVVRRFDAVHVHGIWSPFQTLLCWEAERSGLATILAPHGMLSNWSLAHKQARKSAALAIIWQDLIRHATRLQALSAAEATDLRARFPGRQVAVVPNGVSPANFSDLPAKGEAWRAVPSLRRGRRFVLFLARLHLIKAPDLLVEAFANLARLIPDLDLIIAGPDFGMERQLRAQVELAGLAGRVHWPGAVYGRTKLALLQDALCLCQPSRYEAFSVSMLEALACGVPVITTASANFPEIATEGAGAIAAADPVSLAAAIAELASNETLRARQSAAARELAAARYTWWHIESQARAMYEQAIAEVALTRLTGLRTAGRA
jgi:glycosyltransferase involved in cell wall biosynthesis